MQKSKPNLANLVSSMPDADRPGQESKFTGPHPKEAEKVFTEILGGGRESILELIALLRDPVDPGDRTYKANYVLHSLAVHVGRLDKKYERRLLAEVIASELAGKKHSRAIQAFLIRELQVIGTGDVAGAIGAKLLSEDLCEDAAQALVAIKDGAADHFRKALPRVKGGSRVTIIQALGVLGDTASVAALKEAVGDSNGAVRIQAAWALAKAADPSATETVIKAADTSTAWERIQMHKACLLLAEHLAAAGKKRESARIYTHLRDTRKDPAERYVSEAAEKALAALAL